MEIHGIPAILALLSLLLVVATSFALSDGATGFLAIILSLSVGVIVNRHRRDRNRLFLQPLTLKGFVLCAKMLSRGFAELTPYRVPMSAATVKLCEPKISACAPMVRFPYKISDISELALLEGAQAPPLWSG